MFTGNILVTGGAGYWGRGFIRRAHRENWPCNITVFSRDEAKHIRVRSKYPDVKFIRGSVTEDISWLTRVFSGYDTIIHAGANKLVDIGESAVFELIDNNVIGTRNVAMAAIHAGVKQVIGISSDKAVLPVNTYGSTKMMLERIFQEADLRSDTQFTAARYGNVVGSTISILTYFKEQMKDSGFIQLTNPAMTRFYMGVDEAIDAVLYAYHDAQRGSVVIPKMQSMSVGDFARLFLELPEGAEINESTPKVKIIGNRPGEKLHESLLHTQESVRVLYPEQEDYTYLELRPSIEKAVRDCEFEITSNHAPLGTMSRERMNALIVDSLEV